VGLDNNANQQHYQQLAVDQSISGFQFSIKSVGATEDPSRMPEERIFASHQQFVREVWKKRSL
jgi:hypothetical protein